MIANHTSTIDSSSKNSSLHSMTGFATLENKIGKSNFRIELKTLNHRFLDIKVRIPREFSSIESQLRNELKNRFTRGSVDFKIDLLTSTQESPTEYQTNLSLAAHFYECLIKIQKTLGLTDPIRTSDIISFPNVITKMTQEESLMDPEILWPELLPFINQTINQLLHSREIEGKKLGDNLHSQITLIREKLEFIRQRRKNCLEEYKLKLRNKIAAIFENYPLPLPSKSDQKIEVFLETRIAQELALLLDRTDIEEELVRFSSHLDHFEQAMILGSPTGKKMDFILQELSREINTLGNKSQDFSIIEEVVEIKTWVEQLREQVMNIE